MKFIGALKKNEHGMPCKYDIIGISSYFSQGFLATIRIEINQFSSAFSQAWNNLKKKKKSPNVPDYSY